MPVSNKRAQNLMICRKRNNLDITMENISFGKWRLTEVVPFLLLQPLLKINLGINRKMPKELIHENTTTIPKSTNMLNNKSPHAITLETTFTHLKSRSFHSEGGPEKATLVEQEQVYVLTPSLLYT